MDVYKIKIPGGEPIRLTTHPSRDFSPIWSPDGENIAFHSFRQGSRDIYSMTKDGGSVQTLTHESSQDTAPLWSSDGSKLLFLSDRTGRSELYVLSEDITDWGEPELDIISDDPYLQPGLIGFSVDDQYFYTTIRKSESNIWVMDLILPDS